jgi:hypothetical protein
VGLYDTVMVPCPQCGTRAEFQSKSGVCDLETYALHEAPDDVLRDVNRNAPVTCSKCQARFGVEIEGPRRPRTLIARPTVWKDVDGKRPGEE